MNLTASELAFIPAAIAGVLMAGSTHLRVNLSFYALQTLAIAIATALIGEARAEPGLYYVAIAFGTIKGIAIPIFLTWIIERIQIRTDTGALIAAPLAMHLSVILLGISYLFTQGLPIPPDGGRGWTGATSSISLVLTGLLIMLTRRVAISQIVGFLVIENGIYLFALTQTRDMPMIIEMGVLLDVLVGVMISGLLVFGIKKSFEHIDVTKLTELTELKD